MGWGEWPWWCTLACRGRNAVADFPCSYLVYSVFQWTPVCKAVPLQAWSGPEVSRKFKFPDFMTTAQDGGKVDSLSTDRLYPQENIPGTHLCYRLSRPQGHSATGRIMSLKNSNDIIGNRTRDELLCVNLYIISLHKNYIKDLVNFLRLNITGDILRKTKYLGRYETNRN